MWRVDQTDASTSPTRRITLTVGLLLLHARDIRSRARDLDRQSTHLRISYTYRLFMTTIELSRSGFGV
jgi:hypothetical protein